MPMDISTLKSKKIVDLLQIAKDYELSGVNDLRKQELIFKILEAQTKKDGLTFSQGVLEVLSAGVGAARVARSGAGHQRRARGAEGGDGSGDGRCSVAALSRARDA